MKTRADRLIPRRLRWLLGDRVNIVIALTATALLTGFCEAGILAIFAETASALVTGQDSVHLELGPVLLHPSVGVLLVIAFMLALARVGLGFAQSFLPPRIAGNVQAKLRRQLLTAFMGASWSIQSQDREGHLQETITSQANQASQVAVAASGLVGSVLAFLVLATTALLLSPFAVLIIMLMAGVLFGILHPLRATGREQAYALSRAQLEFASAIGEANRMAEETQVFGVTAAQEKRVSRYIDHARDLFIRTQSILALVPIIYQSVLYLFMVAGLAVIYNTGAGEISSLGAVVLLLIRAGTYGQAIQGGYQTVQQSMPFVDRVRDMACRYALSSLPEGDKPLARVTTMAFEHVSFEYQPDVPVLSDINFKVAAGEAIGIVGPSGAGKSSTVQILLRLRDPTAGQYLVNGVPAGEFFRKDWQARVACVPQEPHLIHATVADNIRYYRAIDDEQVMQAARSAHIHNEIEDWVNGYATIVGPRADAVSGGQQQRICLARALATKPDILILDEPTSALDPRSEALVRQSLGELKHQLTLFVIAHGSALLDICDRVMVIVDGRLEAFEAVSSLSEASSYHRSIAGLGLETIGDRSA